MASLKPPFTTATAYKKVKFAQAKWNTCNPEEVSKGYAPDCIWRNRTTFIEGTDQIVSFLTAKWKREQDYRLRKELFAVGGDKMEKIAVQFWYEYRDAEDGMKWKRCYGLEDWTFNDEGKMKKRQMSGNDLELGTDGNGTAVPEEGIEGRWFVEGVEVDDVRISDQHW